MVKGNYEEILKDLTKEEKEKKAMNKEEQLSKEEKIEMSKEEINKETCDMVSKALNSLQELLENTSKEIKVIDQKRIQRQQEMEDRLRKLRKESKNREAELKERGKQLKMLYRELAEGKDMAEVQQILAKLKGSKQKSEE